jgi:hypothetical protein
MNYLLTSFDVFFWLQNQIITYDYCTEADDEIL